jgi:predicted RNase H-like HicB family nuclease
MTGFAVPTAVPALPEVNSQGRTLDEAREMVRDAARMAIELRCERGEQIPTTYGVVAELVELGG